MNTLAMLELINVTRTVEQLNLLDDMYRAEMKLDFDASNLDLCMQTTDEDIERVQSAIADKLLELEEVVYNPMLALNECLASFENTGSDVQKITGFQVLDWLENQSDSTVLMHDFVDKVAKKGYTLSTPVLKVFGII